MQKNKRTTDREVVKNHLKSGKSLTSLQAIKDYGIMRLASRICDLRKEYGDGQILSIKVISREGERYAEYFWDFEHPRSPVS